MALISRRFAAELAPAKFIPTVAVVAMLMMLGVTSVFNFFGFNATPMGWNRILASAIFGLLFAMTFWYRARRHVRKSDDA
jgi:drug/metabolite transporter (DMT)-like permease